MLSRVNTIIFIYLYVMVKIPVLCLLILAGVVVLRSGPADTLLPVDDELRSLVLEGKYEKAIDYVNDGDGLDGYDHFKLGILYQNLGNTNKSIQNLTRALMDSVPMIDGILYNLFTDYTKKGDLKTATRIFGVMIKRGSPREVLSVMIDTLAGAIPEKKAEERLGIYRNGLEVKFRAKDKVKIYTGLARSYFDMEEYDSVMVYASKVLGYGLGYEPYTGEAYNLYRAVAKIGGKAGRKEKYFLANYYYQIKKYKKSYGLILKEMKQPKSNKKYLLLLMAKVRYRQRYYHQAKLLFQKWVDNYGNTRDVMMLQARCFRYMGYVKAANEKYKEFLETYPRASRSRDILWLMAWQNEMRGAYTSATDYYQKVYTRFKRNNRAILAYWRKGYCLYKDRKYQAAFDHWKEYGKHFSATRGKVRCLYWMGNIQLKRGAKKSAARYFTKTVRADYRSYYAYKSAEQLRALGKKVPVQGPDSLKNLKPAVWLAKLDNYKKVWPDSLSQRGELSLERAAVFLSVGMDDWAYTELKVLKKYIKGDMVFNYDLVNRFNSLGHPEWAFAFSKTFFWKVANRYMIHAPDSLERLLYPRYFDRFVIPSAVQRNVDPDFVFGLIMQESMFDPEILSPVGAVGLMQIMPYTGRQIAGWLDDTAFTEEQLTDPEVNVRYGSEYISRMLKRFGGNKVLALSAYNAGPHRARRWMKKGKNKSYDEFIEDIEFTETRKYIKKVLRNSYNYKDIWKKDPEGQ